MRTIMILLISLSFKSRVILDAIVSFYDEMFLKIAAPHSTMRVDYNVTVSSSQVVQMDAINLK